jgi:hypothetical protein
MRPRVKGTHDVGLGGGGGQHGGQGKGGAQAQELRGRRWAGVVRGEANEGSADAYGLGAAIMLHADGELVPALPHS